METTEIKKPNCPECGNNERVYDVFNDPTYGVCILCQDHGIQICDQEKLKKIIEGRERHGN